MSAVDPSKEPGLSFHQIFLLQAHFQHGGEMLSIESVDAEELSIEVSFGLIELTSANSETTEDAIGMTVRVKTTPESPHPYIFDVEMMAIVGTIPGMENLSLKEYATAAGGSVLYPFLREAVANLTSRGRFGAIWLRPFNVRAAVAQQMQASADPQSP